MSEKKWGALRLSFSHAMTKEREETVADVLNKYKILPGEVVFLSTEQKSRSLFDVTLLVFTDQKIDDIFL